MPKKKTKPMSVKLPVCLVKGMSDGPCNELRFMIEVPEHYLEDGTKLDLHKGEHFVILGPLGSDEDKAIEYMEALGG
jgi:hypothetical protein